MREEERRRKSRWNYAATAAAAVATTVSNKKTRAIPLPLAQDYTQRCVHFFLLDLTSYSKRRI